MTLTSIAQVSPIPRLASWLIYQSLPKRLLTILETGCMLLADQEP